MEGCVNKSDECKDIYFNYKKFCDRTSKCELKDFEKMDGKEFDIYVNTLINQYNDYKNCYELRLKHSLNCVREDCWNRGHTDVMFGARNNYILCKSILISMIKFINSNLNKINSEISENYNKLSELFKIGQENEIIREFRKLNKQLDDLDNLQKQYKEEKEKILKNKITETSKHMLSGLNYQSSIIHQEKLKIQQERKKIRKLMDKQELKDEKISDIDKEINSKIEELKIWQQYYSNLKNIISEIMILTDDIPEKFTKHYQEYETTTTFNLEKIKQKLETEEGKEQLKNKLKRQQKIKLHVKELKSKKLKEKRLAKRVIIDTPVKEIWSENI